MKRLLLAALAFAPAASRADAWERKYYYEDITRPFFVPDAARPGRLRSGRPGAYDLSFPAAKPAGALRVFLVGGAVAKLLHSERASEDFGRALRSVLPSREVEVLNCGMMGYDSSREALLETEILGLSPDLIVFLTGHYEGIAPLGAAPESPGARDEAFERNLAGNLRRARERGVAAAIVVPPRNYREPAEVDRMLYDAEFVPGWVRFLRGDYAGARKFWTDSLSPEAGGAPNAARKAFTWGFIARAEEKLGLAAEARASFERADSFDRTAICAAPCQDIIRRQAKSEGAFLVEADRMFRALAYPRMPGMETFNERKNWKPAFNCLMSAEIIKSVRSNPAFASLPWDDARVRALEASCPKPGGRGDVDDDYLVLSYVLVELSRPGFRRLSTVSVFYLQSILENRPAWFNDVPALMNETLKRQAPVHGVAMAPAAVLLPRFYWHLGESRLAERDYVEAAADFRKALELEPKLPWARLSLAAAETLRGDKKRGLELLQSAIASSAGDASRDELLASAAAAGKELGLGGEGEVSGGDPEHWLEKAEAARASGNKSEGLAALDRARTLAPRPDQLRRIGQSYRQFHETGRFLALSEELSAAYPLDVDLWLARAEASFTTGRRADGLAALTRAEALTPDPAQRRQIASWRRWLQAGAPADRHP
jgi:tetratricopeptide (TPR) repeat protein